MLSFLQGGGDLGALIRAKDWGATPLGPPESWPQSLKTTLGILLNSRYPMFVFWGPHLIKIYNDAYRPITGHKHPWALGRPAKEVWPEIWSDIKPLVDRALSGDPTWSDDLMLFMERNGFPEEVYFTFSYSPIVDESGIGGMFCACTETTGEVLGERRLRTLRDLAAAPAETRSVTAACALSADVLGANAADVPFALIYLAHEEGAVRLHAQVGTGGSEPGDLRSGADGEASWPVHRVMTTGVAEEVQALADRFVQRPAGPWPEAPDRAMVLPLIDRGLNRGIGALVLGISARRPFDDEYRQWFELVARQVSASVMNARAAEEERKRAEALAELDRAKSTFFNNVSHEFRTPLTLMLAPIEDRLRSASGDGSPPWLSEVYRNGLRLQKLVNSLMEFSRIEAGRVQAVTELIDLAAFTADLASLFRSACERAGLRFEVAVPETPLLASVDRGMWERIVLNLLSNAFKFTLEGGISISLSGEGDDVVLRVTDSGCGIPTPELARIFERFHRVAVTHGRTFEGTGIGLALVDELARLHRGEVSVESTEGAGSTFTVRLPVRAEAAAPAPSLAVPTASAASQAFVQEALRWLPDEALTDSTAPPPAASANASDPSEPAAGRRYRILVADDNADMRAYLRRLFGERWEVTTVPNGAAALVALQDAVPDLVIADVMMPGLDGFGLLARVRENRATRRVPVILLSARAGEESQVEGLSAGADDYIVKPFSSRELMARVETQLLRHEVRTLEREERERLSRVFEQAPAGIAMMRGPDHVFEFANPRYVEMAGRRSLVGLPIRAALPELEGQGVFELLDDAYATGRPFVGHSMRVVLSPDDAGGAPREHFFDFVYQPMFDRTGAVDGLAVIAFDVTDLVNAKAAAETASRAKDEFLALLGHELRNPLAPIMTAVQLMRLKGVSTAEREQTIIERQVRHLTRLVDDLLDVSRVARGKVELRRDRVEAGEVVARALEMASPLIEQLRHEVAINVPSRDLPVDGDLPRLAQVIANLLTNAAKYTEPGGLIEIEAHREGLEVVISVSDSGVGIAPDILPSIFDLFVQAPQAPDRARGGLGIGLALVKGLVTLHGGSVEAASDGLGHGARFTVRLPYYGVPAAASAPPLVRPGVELEPVGHGRRVLIVDDNADAAEMLALSLEAFGFETRTVNDSASALGEAAAFSPDVAILDIGLPVMDGYELAQQLRRNRALRHTRWIALSGYGLRHDRQRSEQAGFDAHLVKPVDIHELSRVIKGLAEEGHRSRGDRTAPTSLAGGLSRPRAPE